MTVVEARHLPARWHNCHRRKFSDSQLMDGVLAGVSKPILVWSLVGFHASELATELEQHTFLCRAARGEQLLCLNSENTLLIGR